MNLYLIFTQLRTLRIKDIKLIFLSSLFLMLECFSNVNLRWLFMSLCLFTFDWPTVYAMEINRKYLSSIFSSF